MKANNWIISHNSLQISKTPDQIPPSLTQKFQQNIRDIISANLLSRRTRRNRSKQRSKSRTWGSKPTLWRNSSWWYHKPNLYDKNKIQCKQQDQSQIRCNSDAFGTTDFFFLFFFSLSLSSRCCKSWYSLQIWWTLKIPHIISANLLSRRTRRKRSKSRRWGWKWTYVCEELQLMATRAEWEFQKHNPVQVTRANSNQMQQRCVWNSIFLRPRSSLSLSLSQILMIIAHD